MKLHINLRIPMFQESDHCLRWINNWIFVRVEVLN